MDIITKFYTSFREGDIQGMISCYHKDILFEDPAFGKLNHSEVSAMWLMLVERSKGKLSIEFKNVKTNVTEGSCQWEAQYKFGKSKRPVHNVIQASFVIQDGLIIKHTDQFDFWKWIRQALGLPGLLLGWTSFLQNKFQSEAAKQLERFMQKNNL
jgi:hypothetical protein